MKRWPLGFLLVIALSAHAQSFWDGNAAVQRGDAAFEDGLFVRSNAFALDTVIVIEDTASGATTTATVVGRADGFIDILVLLSPAAAKPLDLAFGDVRQVRVTVKRVTTATAPIIADEAAATADPDRIVVQTAAEEPVVEEPVVEEPLVEEPVVEEPVVEEPVVEEPVVEEPVVEEPVVEEPVVEEPVVEEPVVEEPVVEEPVETEDPLVAELAGRSPQKRLHLPPREDEMFVYQEPVEPPTVEVATGPETVEVATGPETVETPLAEEPSVTPGGPETVTLAEASVAGPEIASDPRPAAPASTAESVTLAEAAPPAEIRPELVETLAATAPAPFEEPRAALAEPEPGATGAAQPVAAAVEPAVTTAATTTASAASTATTTTPATATEAATTSPVVTSTTPTASAAAATTAAAAATAPVAVVLDLPAKGNLTWYLQLAAYSTEAMARDTAARLTPTYPVLVLAPPAGSRPLYRVIVGPLNKAESGTLLTRFRYSGFPDVFARAAN